MLILTMRTDKPEAEIGLFDDLAQLTYKTWPAHRQLSDTIHRKIDDLLAFQSLTLKEVEGIVCFKGPGSFTGLRIGLSITNALAYGLDVPVVATTGEDWVGVGVKRLQSGENDHIALPHYGAPVHITHPKH